MSPLVGMQSLFRFPASHMELDFPDDDSVPVDGERYGAGASPALDSGASLALD